jgi:hypothetical protein
MHWDNDCSSYQKDPTKAWSYEKTVTSVSYLEAYAATVEPPEFSSPLPNSGSESVDTDEVEFMAPEFPYDQATCEVLTAVLTLAVSQEFTPKPSARRPPGMAVLGTEALKVTCQVNS